MPRLSKKSRAVRISSPAKTRTLHSRPPLYRFQEIFHAFKTGRYPNLTRLAETIETTKTIQRDIDYMRYQMSVPIEFDCVRSFGPISNAVGSTNPLAESGSNRRLTDLKLPQFEGTGVSSLFLTNYK